MLFSISKFHFFNIQNSIFHNIKHDSADRIILFNQVYEIYNSFPNNILKRLVLIKGSHYNTIIKLDKFLLSEIA